MGILKFLMMTVLIFFTWPLILGGVVLYALFMIVVALMRAAEAWSERRA
jgi:hypothetical protein